MAQRLSALDRLRVLATFAVIAIHITAGYVLVSPVAYYTNQWVRFAVPLFIIMSGYLIYYADHTTGFLPLSIFYRKRLSKVFVPYIIWTLLYGSLLFMMSGAPLKVNLLIICLAKNLLWGTAFYHLYFLLIILQLYFLYPLIRRRLESSWGIWLGASLVLTLTTQTILYLNMISLITLPSGFQNLYLVAFPGWIFYFVLGMCVALKKDLCENYLNQHRILPALIYLISLGLLVLDSRLTSTYGSSIRPSVILYTISSYFFFYAVALGLKRPVSHLTSWLAQQSFLIFLLHPLVLLVLTVLATRFNVPLLWSGVSGMLLLYLITSAATLIITFVASRTPIAAWIGGTSRNKIIPAK
jgi:surface polysaccharide O-acyltransferase-like enzyme